MAKTLDTHPDIRTPAPAKPKAKADTVKVELRQGHPVEMTVADCRALASTGHIGALAALGFTADD